MMDHQPAQGNGGAEQSALPTLAELELRRRELADKRTSRLKELYAEIGRINYEFDREALRIGRQIAKLRPARIVEEPAPKPVRPRKALQLLQVTEDDGFTAEEIEHFNELRKAKR